jgi:hypothetical protein
VKYSSGEPGEEDCRSSASAKFDQAGYSELVSRHVSINVLAMKKLEHLGFDNTFARLPMLFAAACSPRLCPNLILSASM